MKIVLASGNPGKAAEIAQIFSNPAVDILPQSDFGIESPPETGTTFVANAMIKARHAASVSGLAAIADDSGIVVDALGGRPGVHSARYAGAHASDDDNLDKLLAALADMPAGKRGAGFHCAAVIVFPDVTVEPLVAEGIWRGRILTERRGSGGFGYDPVFLDESSGKTGAEMSPQEKNRVSHRGIAFRKLAGMLAALSPATT